MADIRKLTVGQCETLERLLTQHRPTWDSEGLGIHNPSLHVETHPTGMIVFWMDGDTATMTGTLSRTGTGLVWIQPVGPATLTAI